MRSRHFASLLAIAGCAAAPPRPAPRAPAPSSTPAPTATAPTPTTPAPPPDVEPVDREVDPPTVAVDLPVPPSFDPPAAEPGFTSFQELRVHGRAHFGEQVKVKGYVTWIYDCVSDVMRDGQTRAQVQASIDDHPEQCVRPRIEIGPTKGGSDLTAISVVEIARPPNKGERSGLPKAELAAWPKVPVFALGDQIVVTGTWTDRSPHGDGDPDGLIVYGWIERVKP